MAVSAMFFFHNIQFIENRKPFPATQHLAITMRATVTFLFAVFLFLAGLVPAADDNFKGCLLCGFWDNSRLQAVCNGPGSTIIASELDLNNCISDDDGQLIAADDGHYNGSCSYCSAKWTDSLYLTCSCANNHSQMVIATLDLYNIVDNIDGYLSCNGGKYNATKHLCGTPDDGSYIKGF
ncbi:hypothetical protein QBC46DRAFT_345875 [Diplogelasinospora grovesii]|uniref:Cyanovirin-N domain-containing protein n=1 Tax=Diplogelasinospora grovesii TaxID=303347 RepID=A0AAN6MZ50_9PEZI|nr:hypothetical protein QBC46DRAFT_345875 [Diplogelasinospora grovesii]